MDILTFHSRVVCGYVGNSVAVPIIQHLGHNAWPIDTIVLGHHPGHGPTARNVTNPEVITALANSEINRLTSPCAVLLGYLGNPEQGHAISDVLINARNTGREMPVYLDPVFGDTSEGIYVDPKIIEYYNDIAIPMAQVVMPNCFELAHLTGRKIHSISDAVIAARMLVVRGPDIVMVSSVPGENNMLANVIVTAEKAWASSTKHLELKAKGTGDLLSAAFTALHAGGQSVPDAFQFANKVVIRATVDASTRGLLELDIPNILAQNMLEFKELQLTEF